MGGVQDWNEDKKAYNEAAHIEAENEHIKIDNLYDERRQMGYDHDWNEARKAYNEATNAAHIKAENEHIKINNLYDERRRQFGHHRLEDVNWKISENVQIKKKLKKELDRIETDFNDKIMG